MQPLQISSSSYARASCVPRRMQPTGKTQRYPRISRRASLKLRRRCCAGCGELFGGSYDWHSCVHAHWALAGMARAHNDADLEDFLLQRLTPHSLARVADELSAAPEFELPYGQAWLLLLLCELSQPCSLQRAARLPPASFERLRCETEERVRACVSALRHQR